MDEKTHPCDDQEVQPRKFIDLKTDIDLERACGHPGIEVFDDAVPLCIEHLKEKYYGLKESQSK
jgi:hypothetical protein